MSRRVNSAKIWLIRYWISRMLLQARGGIYLYPLTYDEQLNKYLSFEGDDFRWKGTSDQLKRFFAEDLKFSGKLTSPSGGVWSFSTKEYEVKWQKSMKLVVVRDNTDKFMLKLSYKVISQR